MTKKQPSVIIKTNAEAFTFEQITSFKKSDIIKIKDLLAVTSTVSDYFKQHTFPFECGNNKPAFAFLKPNLEYDIIELSTPIAFGLTVKDLSGSSIAAKLKRVKDKDYLLNLFKKSASIFYEVIHFYHDKNAEYITDKAVTANQKKKKFNQKYVDNTLRTSANGKPYLRVNLEEKKKNNANAYYSNAMQLAEYAAFNKHSWLTATITCPAVFHIKPINGKNSWDGQLTPTDNNVYLNTIIQNLTKKLNTKKIKRYGHCSKEPHKSMALHAHMLIYCDSKNISEIKELINHYTDLQFINFNCDFIENISVKFDEGDCESKSNKIISKGIAKYIHKHVFHCLNSPAFSPRLTKSNPKKFVEEQLNNKKIEAHADKFNYRRISFFGVDSSLTLWKKLKLLSYNKIKPKAPSMLFNTLYNMAGSNQFKEFLIGSYHKAIQLIFTKKNNGFNGIYNKTIGIHIDGYNYLI